MSIPKFLNIRLVFIFSLLASSSVCANIINTPYFINNEIANSNDLTKSVDDLVTAADIQFNAFQYKKAIELYDEILKKNNKPTIHVIQNLADSYFNLSKYSEAGVWYTKLYEMQNGALNEKYIIKLIECLKANRQIRKADEILIEYYKNKEQLKLILAQKKDLNNQRRKNEKYTISNLEFNSEASDFGPALSKDGLIFISSREKEISNSEAQFELFKTWPEGSAADVENYSAIFEASNYAQNLTFSRDSKTVYFTRNNYKGSSNLQILSASINNNRLSNIKVLNFNSKNYTCKQPALSADGKYLYFSSDMPGGYGESDLYKVALKNNGTVLSEPINLGSKINTPGREEYPFVEGQQIYFSSDAHYGMGGLDIFSSQIISDSNYSIPLNLGTPVNSSMDDFSFIAERSRNNAYFSSNRPGGKGETDIYHLVKNETETFQEYSGYVLDQNTKAPIANAQIELSSNSSNVNFTFQTDANGYYNLKLPSNKQIKMIFHKENYTKNQVGVETGRNPTLPSINNMIYLNPSNVAETFANKSATIEVYTNNYKK
ncbi:PD40 domain-containing protein [Aurantibacter crassamenti]|uniref:carboxypeptidase regulatory-like domain-containing protein n=1 Tax=Aurantibacter crassamenti TaxID=1837375 RepID=UPI00193A2FE7|nr:carboxypeptidase regulatory-like domain-containing protein [Aurantibacter crassamenti]MBM1107738.1 PD40 domain-containing protein [Aurantibacter crassamenti]